MNNRLAGPYKCKTGAQYIDIKKDIFISVARYRVVQLSLSQSVKAEFPRHTRSAYVKLIPEAVNICYIMGPSDVVRYLVP